MSKARHNFLDAQRQHLEHPETFEVPSQQELDLIKKGDSVKVCLEGERFWTTVINKTEQRIMAQVDNDLVYFSKHGLKLGDYIEYEEKNVLAIL